ncbi:hypothetical protein [uncultured Croceitalea sp.]|uniref:hypothetical protein n=1 Tax=uncultured Croceitalea sp. TaxID=1798908 RepID=UPI00374EF5A2
MKGNFFLFLYVFASLLSCRTASQTTSEQDKTSPLISSFSEFENTENERDKFKREIIQLDSLAQGNNYLGRIKNFEPKIISVNIQNGILKIDFAQLFCEDYKQLQKENVIPNLERLRKNDLLKINCRGLASDLDIFPARTGNLATDSKTYLETIKVIIEGNKEKLEGLTYEQYLGMEGKRDIDTDSKRFVFRKRFLKFLSSKYYVSIN